MKITVDKEYTHISKKTAVRDTLNAMKKAYTENDLLTLFNDATGHNVRGEVLRCEVSGYDNYFNVGASVDMIVYEKYSNFTTVRCYIDIDCEGTIEKFATDPLLVTVEKYRKVI